MKVQHFFEESIYVISNYAVARNPLFSEKYYCKRFLRKVAHYLGPICDILSYGLMDNEFQLLIRLKSREVILDHYRSKLDDFEIESHKIPESTYIFSQCMANLQSSTAIHFNRREGRQGALFAARFQRFQVCSEREYEYWLDRIHNLEKMNELSDVWGNNLAGKGYDRWVVVNYKRGYRSSYKFYDGGGREGCLEVLRGLSDSELQGQFKNSAPRSLKSIYSKYSQFQKQKIPIYTLIYS